MHGRAEKLQLNLLLILYNYIGISLGCCCRFYTDVWNNVHQDVASILHILQVKAQQALQQMGQ